MRHRWCGSDDGEAVSDKTLRELAQMIVTRWDETVKLIVECGREPAWAESILVTKGELERIRAALADSATAPTNDPCPNCGFSTKRLLKSEAQAERGEHRPLSEAIEELTASADAPPTTNSGEVVNELVVGINDAPADAAQPEMQFCTQCDRLIYCPRCSPAHPEDAPLDDVHRQVIEAVEKLVERVAHHFEDAPGGPMEEVRIAKMCVDLAVETFDTAGERWKERDGPDDPHTSAPLNDEEHAEVHEAVLDAQQHLRNALNRLATKGETG